MTRKIARNKNLLVKIENNLSKQDAPRLRMGKYDLDFCITLIKQMLFMVEKYKFDPRGLEMAMKHSLGLLLATMEVEADSIKLRKINENINT